MDLPMKFEMCMQGIFGYEAHQIAGTYNPKERSIWVKKSLNELLKNIDRLDISEDRKKGVEWKIGRLIKEIPKYKDLHVVSWEIVFNLLSLCFSSFGITRKVDADPLSWQKNSIATRKRLVDQLKGEGYTDNQVALVFGISSYQVKLIKKEKPQDSEEY